MKFAIKEQDLGVWIDSTEMTPAEFSVAVVDLAVTAGLPVDMKSWVKEKKKLLKASANDKLDKDLDQKKQNSIEFLNTLMPDNYEFAIKKETLVVAKKRKFMLR